MLFLEAIVLDNLGFKKKAVGLVFGFDNDARLFGLSFFDLSERRTGVRGSRQEKSATGQTGGDAHLHKGCDAEASSSVEPVIVAELVDLDALLFRRLMRHGLCHHQQVRSPLWDGATGAAAAANQLWREVEMLLERKLGVGRGE